MSFFDTIAGQRFTQGTLPQLNKKLDLLTDHLKIQSELIQKQNDLLTKLVEHLNEKNSTDQ